MRILKKADYLYLNTEGNVSYHLGNNGKLYMYEAKQTENKFVFITVIICVAIQIALRWLNKMISTEFLDNNIVALVVGLSVLGAIAGVIFIETIKDDSFKTFTEEKSIEKNEEMIRYHLHNGFKRRLGGKLFVYGWTAATIVLSVVMLMEYRINYIWLIPLMWILTIIMLYVIKFYGSTRKVEKIIKNEVI